jgi:hypothetical protein
MRNPLLVAAVAVAVAVLAAGCSSGSKRVTPSVTATSPETSLPAASATALPEVVPTAPPQGSPCPLDADVCAAAVKVESWVSAGDVAGIMRQLRGKSYVCPQPGTSQGPGSLYYVCAGAAAGEVRTGFGFGEAPLGEAEFKDRLTAIIMRQPRTDPPDAWGPPEPHVAAVGCARSQSPGGQICDDRLLQVSVTMIGKFADLGIPGARNVYEVNLHRDADGMWVDGIGLAVPPLARLYPLDIPAWVEDTRTTLVSRPWRP